jgi:hypothetical protein
MLPFLLRGGGLDPAGASALFVAMLVDVTGLVIQFSVCKHHSAGNPALGSWGPGSYNETVVGFTSVNIADCRSDGLVGRYPIEVLTAAHPSNISSPTLLHPASRNSALGLPLLWPLRPIPVRLDGQRLSDGPFPVAVLAPTLQRLAC